MSKFCIPGTVTVVIPSIPIRAYELARAVASVMSGARAPDAISIEIDRAHEGAGPTRTKAMLRASSEWIAFIDDDDVWYAQHLERLLATAEETGADVVYPWFDVINPDGERGYDPFPQFEGKPWDPAEPHLFPICALVRTELAQRSFFPACRPNDPAWDGDDWPFWLGVFEQGAKVVHLNERTWRWNHWGISSPENPVGNTSGRGDRW
jgi:glycosyltransferase involved in cell wall biosynthesis